jgi:CRP-like cAMP-binding protein
MLDGVPRSASVAALRNSKLRFIGRAGFEAFGRAKPELYRRLATLLAHRLRETNDMLAATSFFSIKGRVARALLNLAEAFGQDVGQGRIKMSQRDLAAMAGIAGKCQSGTTRLGRSFAGKKSRGLLLSGKQRCSQTGSRGVCVADAHASISQSRSAGI